MGQIVSIVFTIATLSPVAQGLDEQAALAKARQFCQLVERSDLEPSSNRGHNVELDSTSRYPSELRLPNTIRFQFRSALVGVDLETGRIIGYSDLRTFPWESMGNSEVLTRQQVVEYARRYHMMTGYSDAFEVMGCQLSSGTEGPDNYFILHLLRTVQDIPYTEESEIYMEVEQRSGRLLKYSPMEPRLPAPPSSLHSNISPQSARTQMIAKLFTLYPRIHELTEARDVQLAIWRPAERSGGFRYFALLPEQIQSGRDNKGALIYWALFASETQSFGAWVYFDAVTSRVLAVRGSEGAGFGGVAKNSPRAGPYGWGIGPARILVNSGLQSAFINKAQIWRANPLKTSETGKPVIVHFGKTYLRCSFLPIAGLLVTERGGAKSFGKPDKALLKALRGLTSKR